MIDEQNENVYELTHRTVQPFPIDVEPFWILYHDLMGVAWIKDPIQRIQAVSLLRIARMGAKERVKRDVVRDA